jgi:hypothetical protein
MTRQLTAAIAIMLAIAPAAYPFGFRSGLAARGDSPPRTPWGDPDFRGTYVSTVPSTRSCDVRLTSSGDATDPLVAVAINQAPGWMLVRSGPVASTRLIHILAQRHREQDLRRYVASRLGRWELDELVIETTATLGTLGLFPSGQAPTSNGRIVERFARQGESLHYSARYVVPDSDDMGPLADLTLYRCPDSATVDTK